MTTTTSSTTESTPNTNRAISHYTGRNHLAVATPSLRPARRQSYQAPKVVLTNAVIKQKLQEHICPHLPGTYSFPNPIPKIVVTPPDNYDHLNEVIARARQNSRLVKEIRRIFQHYTIAYFGVTFELAQNSKIDGDKSYIPVMRSDVFRYTPTLWLDEARMYIDRAMRRRGFGGFKIELVPQPFTEFCVGAYEEVTKTGRYKEA